jgi:hypothetical protein
MYRVLIVALALTLAVVTVAPTASAGDPPECIQVYPWSELCNGNGSAEAFICYFLYREYTPNCIAIQG